MRDAGLAAETRGPVRWLRLDRTEKKNAVTRAMAESLRAELEASRHDAAHAVVIVTGAGDFFCSGADVGEAFTRRDATIRERRSTPLWPVDELAGFSKPLLCCLNGGAVGGGATLAMTADLRIAARSAFLRFDLGRLGITPELGSSFLLWRTVGYGTAADLLLTGRTVAADEALALRLVQRVVPDSDVEDATQEIAERLAALPHDAAARIKQVLRAGLEASWADARTTELRALADFARRSDA